MGKNKSENTGWYQSASGFLANPHTLLWSNPQLSANDIPNVFKMNPHLEFIQE